MITEADLTISEKNYRRTRLALDLLRKFLKVNIKLHNLHGQLQEGDIFLFNHFARFETFIPQYLMYEQTGKTCRSLAAPDLFTEDAFGRYLRSIGAVPTNFPSVIHFMACELNRGYKIIIFPEGAMIKDRRVLGPKGKFRVYSREIKQHRKPHTGAAVIALYAQEMRDLFLMAWEKGNTRRLREMAASLHTEDLDHAHQIASQPVRIVPANITFYPLRIEENFLINIAERLGKVRSERIEEELIVEGNILFKDTDMDIRLGEPRPVRDYYSRMDRSLLRSRYVVDNTALLKGPMGRMLTRLEMVRSETLSERIMVDYMQSIYALTTVNLGHLCAEIIYQLLERYKQKEVARDFFDIALYLTIKRVQELEHVYLHRTLLDPDRYGSILRNASLDLREILLQAAEAGLIRIEPGRYVFLPALEQRYDFDEIRIRNFLRVRYNEIRPMPAIGDAVREMLTHYDKLIRHDAWASMLFDDDRRSYERDLSIFCAEKYDEINREEVKTASGVPFYFPARNSTQARVGVLLIHGFTASPAEMRPLGEFLSENGLDVYGVRLKGHGTSPCDLDSRTSKDWYQAALRGWDALYRTCDDVFVVGFSMGGNLAFMLAEEKGNEVAGLVTISAPLRIHNRNIRFAGLVNQVNRLVAGLPYLDGIKRFKQSNPEHPEINYLNIPISALGEFKKLMEDTEKCLPEVYAPVLVIQGKEDPTVDPVSAGMILKKLSSPRKKMLMVDADRHVIVLDKGSFVHREVLHFIREHQRTVLPENESYPESAVV
jgi:esterase/lipase/1-acyl-sn-glycerol-3-phosphate acyltransferase